MMVKYYLIPVRRHCAALFLSKRFWPKIWKTVFQIRSVVKIGRTPLCSKRESHRSVHVLVAAHELHSVAKKFQN